MAKSSKFTYCLFCGKNYERKNGAGAKLKYCSLKCASEVNGIKPCYPKCLESNMIFLDVEFSNKTFHTKKICKICRRGKLFVKRSASATLKQKIIQENHLEELDQLTKASKEKYGNSFYTSPNWLALRYKTLIKFGAQCMLCGSTEKPMHVDHIKPRSLYPNLELDENNLQVLCKLCNLGKSNTDESDFRINK